MEIVKIALLYEYDFSNGKETLAWSSAQIHCLCVTNDKVVSPPDASSLSPEERSIVSGGEKSIIMLNI